MLIPNSNFFYSKQLVELTLRVKKIKLPAYTIGIKLAMSGVSLSDQKSNCCYANHFLKRTCLWRYIFLVTFFPSITEFIPIRKKSTVVNKKRWIRKCTQTAGCSIKRYSRCTFLNMSTHSQIHHCTNQGGFFSLNWFK